MTSEKPATADPLKALLRERDEQCLRKKLEREWDGEGMARLLRVEQLTTNHDVRLARLEARLEAVEIDLQRRRR